MVKFLASLINNSRQPARRAGVPAGGGQAAPFNPPHFPQDGLPMKAAEQPVQPAPLSVSQSVPGMASEPRQDGPMLHTGDPGSAALQAGEAPRQSLETRTDSSAPPMSDELNPPPLSREASDATPANADAIQPRPADAPSERKDRPVAAAEAAVPPAQVGDAPVQVAAADPLSVPQPAAEQIPLPVKRAEGMPPLAAVDPITGLAEQDAAADPGQAETRPGNRAQAIQQPGNASAGEPSAPQSRSQGQAEIPVRPLQAAVQQEQAAPRNPFLGQAAPQQQPREIPQVRIGQINVLVEDQTPARPKQNKRSARPAASNPFGLRGL